MTDVKSVIHLVNECRELWANPLGWRQHLVQGTSRSTGMAVVHYSEYSSGSPAKQAVSYCHADVGWRDASARAVYLAAVEAHPDAFHLFPGSERFMPCLEAGRAIAALRSDMCNDSVWYRSPVYNEFRRFAHNDDFTVSLIPRGNGRFSLLNANQDTADPRPTRRAKLQLALLHRLICPLVGAELAIEGQRSLAGLPKRLRTTLDLLLEGDTEKQIATRLGLRPTTVHEYVGKIYQHFDVNSRAELMAYFIRRRPAPM